MESSRVVAPTVTTSPALDGEKAQASRLRFPAAATMLRPLRWMLSTAAFNEALYPPIPWHADTVSTRCRASK